MLADAAASDGEASRLGADQSGPPALRGFSGSAPRGLFVGASTGGIDAICDALASLARFPALPVVITLHIRSNYAPIVARQVTRAASRPCVLALDGAMIRRDSVYLVSGGANWRVARAGARLLLRRQDSVPEGITPSVDVLFRSAAKALGSGALGVVLTGMGTDGLAGATAIIEAGGSVVVQDKGSSVVWGMPGAIAQAGLASAILPPSGLGTLLRRQFPKLAARGDT